MRTARPRKDFDIKECVRDTLARFPVTMEYLRQSERRDAVSADLHALWDGVLLERIPDDMRALLEKLKD